MTTYIEALEHLRAKTSRGSFIGCSVGVYENGNAYGGKIDFLSYVAGGKVRFELTLHYRGKEVSHVAHSPKSGWRYKEARGSYEQPQAGIEIFIPS